MEITKKHKNSTLRSLFIKYFLILCIGILLVLVITAAAFLATIFTGQILPANYSETQISYAWKAIEKTPKVTAGMIPELCEYGVFTVSGSFLSGSFTKDEAALAYETAQKSYKIDGLNRHYAVIPRKNEICIIRYSIEAQFRSALLRERLVSPEIFIIVLFFILFLIEEGKLILSVSDNGEGFSKDDLIQAARPFYKANGSSLSGNHHGMGLYIAESLVKSHGGTLLIENLPSEGGKVTLIIPLDNI